MNLVLFLYIAAFFSLTLGEFGQFPFGKTDFSISATDVFLALAGVALIIWNIGIKKNLILPRNFALIIFFWAICFLSLLFSLDLSGWFYLIRFVIYGLTFYITFNLVKSRILGLKEFLTLVKITGVSLAIVGLLQLIFFPDLEPLLPFGFDPHKNRIFSTFLDPNLFGAFLNFSFVLLLYELISKKITNYQNYIKENGWKLAGLATTGLVIILTFSRSAYLMLVVSTAVILLSKSRRLLLIFITFLTILYFVFPAFSERINGAINIDKSARERFYSWDKGIEIFQQNPILGVGFNNIRNYAQKADLLQVYSSDGGNAGSGIDSSLIFILAATGLVGFISYMLFLYKILADLISAAIAKVRIFYDIQFKPIKFKKMVLEIPNFSKWYRDVNGKNPVRKGNYLTLPLLCLTLGLLVNSIFINSLFFPPILFLWFSLIGVYYGLEEGEGEGEGS